MDTEDQEAAARRDAAERRAGEEWTTEQARALLREVAQAPVLPAAGGSDEYVIVRVTRVWWDRVLGLGL